MPIKLTFIQDGADVCHQTDLNSSALHDGADAVGNQEEVATFGRQEGQVLARQLSDTPHTCHFSNIHLLIPPTHISLFAY